MQTEAAGEKYLLLIQIQASSNKYEPTIIRAFKFFLSTSFDANDEKSYAFLPSNGRWTERL